MRGIKNNMRSTAELPISNNPKSSPSSSDQSKKNALLYKMRKLLTCQLSGEIFKKPVYISCGHVFNSISLDTALSRKDACPKCNTRNVWSSKREDFLLGKICELVAKDIGHEELIAELTEYLSDIVLFNPYLFPVINTCGHTFEKQQISQFKDCPNCHAQFNIQQPNYLIMILVGLLLQEKPELLSTQNKDNYIPAHSPLGKLDRPVNVVLKELISFPYIINRTIPVAGEANSLSVQQMVIKRQEVECLQLLLNIPLFHNGSEHYIFDVSGNTLLTLAAAEKMHSAFDYLLNQPFCNINERNKYGDTPLIIAAANNDEYKVLRLLSDPNIDVNAKDKMGNSAEQIAKDKGLHRIARLLNPQVIQLAKNIKSSDFTAITQFFRTLIEQSSSQLEEYIEFLVINMPVELDSLMHFISDLLQEIQKNLNTNMQIVVLRKLILALLKNNSDLINKPIINGLSPFHYACLINSNESAVIDAKIKILDMLLLRCSNPNSTNSADETALVIAGRCGNEAAFIKLLNLKNINADTLIGGKNLADIARDNDQSNIAFIYNQYVCARNLLAKDKISIQDLKLPPNINLNFIVKNFPKLFEGHSQAKVYNISFILEHCSQNPSLVDRQIDFSPKFFDKINREYNVKKLMEMFPQSHDLFELQQAVAKSFLSYVTALPTKEAKLEWITWAKNNPLFCNNYADPKKMAEASPGFFKRFASVFSNDSAIKIQLDQLYETIRQQPDAAKSVMPNLVKKK